MLTHPHRCENTGTSPQNYYPVVQTADLQARLFGVCTDCGLLGVSRRVITDQKDLVLPLPELTHSARFWYSVHLDCGFPSALESSVGSGQWWAGRRKQRSCFKSSCTPNLSSRFGIQPLPSLNRTRQLFRYFINQIPEVVSKNICWTTQNL